MDLFQHRYYRLNRTLMTLVGYWPYQSTCIRATLSVILLFSLTSQVVPQILALVKYRDDPRIVFECVITFLFEAACITKGISLVWNVQKTLKLLNRIRTDWQVWARDREVNILHEYAEQGRKLTIVYTGQSTTVTVSSEVDKSLIDLSTLYLAGINAAIAVYAIQPIMPTIIDILLKNGTAPRKFPTPVDFYYFDAQNYYWYIVMHNYVSLSTGMIIMVVTEVMLVIYVQHVSGIFAALGRKFQRIGNIDISLNSGGTPFALDMVDLASYIDRHNNAIEFAKLIDSTYTWNIFFVVGFGIILLNVVGFQILLTKSDPEATVRSVGIALGTILHLYVVCNISEILMDHSNSVHLYIHESQWYNLTSESQKPLQLMMMLCRVPCQLTAGNYATLSMRFSGQFVRTAMSYFTFVRSMQP